MELPTRMQYRFRELNKILKQTVTIIPNNGQSDVRDGDTIILELPHNSIVDLSDSIIEQLDVEINDKLVLLVIITDFYIILSLIIQLHKIL